MPNTAFHL